MTRSCDLSLFCGTQEDEGASKYVKEGILSRVGKRLQSLKFWERTRSSYEAAEAAEQSVLQMGITRSGKQPVQVGNVTECALLLFSMSLGLEPEATRSANPVESFVKVSTHTCTHIRTYTLAPSCSKNQ